MKRGYRVPTCYLLWTENEQIRRYNRGEVSQLFSDKEKEQAQNEIRLFIQNANNQVSENEQSYSILFDRYKHDVGYSEAKETIKTRLIVRLLLVVKFKMTYSKMKLREVN